MNLNQHILKIDAPRERVFSALTTAPGLSSWWTTAALTGQPEIGSEISFTFRGPFNPQMRITEFSAPSLVSWEGVGGHAAWGATTTIRFELDDAAGA